MVPMPMPRPMPLRQGLAEIWAEPRARLFTLFVFYEILTLVTYPLVIHRGTPAALELLDLPLDPPHGDLTLELLAAHGTVAGTHIGERAREDDRDGRQIRLGRSVGAGRRLCLDAPLAVDLEGIEVDERLTDDPALRAVDVERLKTYRTIDHVERHAPRAERQVTLGEPVADGGPERGA